jgi:RimJ/RimL family protein N-acetyltransferase
MVFETERLLLRSWRESDTENLFKYASNPLVGPPAGWPPHQSIEESRYIISSVLTRPECYAICDKQTSQAIGAIELKLSDVSEIAEGDEECELGYWLAQEYWGQGLMPEAAAKLIEHAFMDLDMECVWCGYYEGNEKSKRVQEKLGFLHYDFYEVHVPLLKEDRIAHVTHLSKERWLEIRQKQK